MDLCLLVFGRSGEEEVEVDSWIELKKGLKEDGVSGSEGVEVQNGLI